MRKVINQRSEKEKSIQLLIELLLNKDNWDSEPCRCTGRSGLFWIGPDLSDLLKEIKGK